MRTRLNHPENVCDFMGSLYTLEKIRYSKALPALCNTNSTYAVVPGVGVSPLVKCTLIHYGGSSLVRRILVPAIAGTLTADVSIPVPLWMTCRAPGHLCSNYGFLPTENWTTGDGFHLS